VLLYLSRDAEERPTLLALSALLRKKLGIFQNLKKTSKVQIKGF